MLNGRTDLRAGNPVALRADLNKVLVFDRASGRRLR
jgi:multiple sugar transport system ATP-binding protein